MKLWVRGILGGLVGLSVCGCDEPSTIVPITPPGAVIPKTPPDGDVAQAQGEMAAPMLENESEPLKSVEYTPALPTAKGQTKTTPSGVKYETIKEGSGRELKPGNSAKVHYVGTLENGEVFDSSREKNKPAIFPIGSGSMIKGWEEAMPGMRIGEIRKMTVPPALGYGAAGQGKVPPNATLIFEVELLDIL
jgi:FKBP-type peptidyl-prolyl cis-trans isomerase